MTMSDLRVISGTRLPVFGIISGAGPEAGLILQQQIIQAFQQRGAWRDADFPLMHLVNFPFAEMLEEGFSEEKVSLQIKACLSALTEQCDHVLIACQTLHRFIADFQSEKFISLFDLMHSVLPTNIKPLVLASRTSSQTKLHSQLLGRDCDYHDPEHSQAMIDDILKGNTVDLTWLESMAAQRPIILGCTEYSVALQHSKAPFVDPIKLAVNKIMALSPSHSLN